MPTDTNENMPASPRSAGRIFANLTSIWLLCIIEVALIAGYIIAVYVAPSIVKGYGDLDADLPDITLAVLNMSSLAYAGVVGFVACALLLKELLIKKAAVKIIINVVFLLLVLVQVGVIVVALFLPMLKLMQSMTE